MCPFIATFKQIASCLPVMTVKPSAILLDIYMSTTIAAQGIKSGEQVYAQVCFACHAMGVQNAPKFGDKAA